jgi:4-aminobutyrate aminotransferase-like enzyme
VSCAAALANLQVLRKEGLAEAADRKGRDLLGRLQELIGRHRLIGEVRGLGLMIGVELVGDRNAKTPDAGAAGRVQEQMLEDGFLIGLGGFYGNVLRVQPPLVISEDEIGRTVAALDKALSRCAP